MKLARDTWLVFQRQVLLMVRTPIWLVVGVIQPLFYLLLFAPLLKQVLGAGSYQEAYRIYVPGLLAVLVIFGGLFTGFSLLGELRAGIIERSRVTPVSRLALLLGRALREVLALMVQAVIITLLALPFGLTVAPLDLLLAYLLMALLALMTSAISYGIALLVRSDAALAPVVNTVAQPIALLSGVLLPLALAPQWLRSIAEWNPFYWAVEGMRALFAGQVGDSSVWQSLLIVSVLTVVAVWWSARLFAERVR
ncbi:ABC-2 type transport system permease protein [Kitasatospora gansuensis]|uniref:Transport permease protein n=1 Tax=Kitasatospora gansuensis TaxID=258050 RepID=A0A7W7S689_9ACTN|nr:ABC transporter permease [Kitasatospora gansuensis]MBB4944660.1 ABC-2 type transport system permease protein [Kitasatospora gansuensis]